MLLRCQDPVSYNALTVFESDGLLLSFPNPRGEIREKICKWGSRPMWLEKD